MSILRWLTNLMKEEDIVDLIGKRITIFGSGSMPMRLIPDIIKDLSIRLPPNLPTMSLATIPERCPSKFAFYNTIRNKSKVSQKRDPKSVEILWHENVKSSHKEKEVGLCSEKRYS